MDAKRETKRILGALNRYRRSLGWGSSYALDRKLKRSEGYVRRYLSGQMAMRLELLFETVGALGFEAGEFFAWVYGDECRVSPSWHLLDLEKKAEPNALLRKADTVIATLTTQRETVSDTRQAVAQLEDLRFSFPLRALEKGETLLRETLSPAAAGHPVDALALCEVLAALGSIQRALGEYALSAAYLTRALALAERHDLDKTGELLHQCSNLVADQGDMSSALALASRAREAYTLQHNLPGIGKTLVAEGIISRNNGNVDRAISCFESSLLYLPEDLWRFRVTAYHGLAVAVLEQDRLDESEDCLNRAYAEHQTREGFSWDKMLWLRGEVAFARGNLAEAEAAFQLARNALAIYNNAIDVALVSLRLCQVLQSSGRVPEMMGLISEMIELLQPLRDNSIAEGVLGDILKEALTGQVTMDLLDRAHMRLEKAAEKA